MPLFEPSNWFGPSETGQWTERVSSREASWLSIAFIGMLVLLIWGATVPELFVMCMCYLVMLGVSFGAIVLNYFAPKNPFFATLSAGNNEKIIRGLLIGVFICVIAVIVNGIVIRTNFLQSFGIVDPVAVNLILVLLPIPFIEELFSGAFLTPTLAEKGGIIFSLVGNILIFMTLHWVIFDASLDLLLVSGCFRGMASFTQLSERSWVPGFAGHMYFNVLQVISFSAILF